MSQTPPFYGQIRVTIQGKQNVFYIAVHGANDISIHNQPPPFELTNLVGFLGISWRIRRIKRGWIMSVFIITFLEENTEYECTALNSFGDSLVKYTTQ